MIRFTPAPTSFGNGVAPMFKWFILFAAIAFVLASVIFADPAQERCEQIYSHDTCFEILNR